MTEMNDVGVQLLHDADEFRFRTSELASVLAAATSLIDLDAAGSFAGSDFLARFDRTPTPMDIVGADDRYIKVNEAFAELVGRPVVDLIGRPVAAVVHEMDHPSVDPVVGRRTNDAEHPGHRGLRRYVRPDGKVVWAWMVSTTVSPCVIAGLADSTPDLAGGPIRIGQFVDVTSQIDVLGRALAAHHEIADREERLRELALPGADPVVRVAADGTVLYANEAALAVFATDDMAGQRIADVLPAPVRPELSTMIDAAVENGRSLQLARQQLVIGDSIDPRWYLIRVVPELTGRRAQSVYLVLVDVTGGVESERRLTAMALTDPLTGIANRAAILDRLEHALNRVQRRGDTGVAVLAVDIDNFKSLNDVYGHAFGDEALVQFAQRATATIRGLDSVGRIGGDEFLFVLEDTESVADARRAAERVAAELMPFTATSETGPSVEVSISIGMAWTDESVEAASLIAAADERLLLAKRNGRGRLWLPDTSPYDVEVSSRSASRRDLVRELRRAIDDDQFVLHYQPVVDRDDSVVAVEALVRWEHPDRGTLGPDSFVPLLIETGQIATVGTWVMETAIAQLASWRRAGSPVLLNINASAGEIGRVEYRTALRRTLERTGVAPDAVNVELTEQALASTAVSEPALAELSACGVNLVLDDFGTGISSLSHLRTRSLSGVKIDRSFVSDTSHGDIDRRIACGVTQLAHEIGVLVTAEGVETEEQSDWIHSIGCDFLQGYYFGRPVTVDVIGARIADYLTK